MDAGHFITPEPLDHVLLSAEGLSRSVSIWILRGRLTAYSGRMLSPARWWFILLVAAAVLQGGMALAHFGLQYEWSLLGDFGRLPLQLAWALFALNFSWGVLLFAISALVIYAARIGPDGGKFVGLFVFLIGLFWLLHGTYVVLVPMPLPPQLQWIRTPLVAFPVIIVALHWMPLWLVRSQRAVGTAGAPAGMAV